MKKLVAAVILAAALACTAAPPASADYGDWSYQRDLTRSYADQGRVRDGGWDLQYVYSGAYGEHSRAFRWGWLRAFPDGWVRRCVYEWRIDHNYYVFNVVQAGACYKVSPY